MTSNAQFLQNRLRSSKRPDLAEAVAGAHKYLRLEDLLGGNFPNYEGAVGLRLALDPTASVPADEDEWIEEALLRFPASGLQEVETAWFDHLEEHEDEWEAILDAEWSAAAPRRAARQLRIKAQQEAKAKAEKVQRAQKEAKDKEDKERRQMELNEAERKQKQRMPLYSKPTPAHQPEPALAGQPINECTFVSSTAADA